MRLRMGERERNAEGQKMRLGKFLIERERAGKVEKRKGEKREEAEE